MASCTQVSSLLQAYIDGELGHAEKSILEQHLRECGACRHELTEHSACAARIFESMADHRLQWGLRSRVLAHLPEMDPAPVGGSHPTDPQLARRRQRNPIMPGWLVAAAALALVSLGAYVYERDSVAPPTEPAVGMVTFVDSERVLHRPAGSDGFENAELTAVVRPESEFQTLDDGRLAVSLIAGSLVKVNHNSTLTVRDHRNIAVVGGQTWFDVGYDKRLFNVHTPAGDLVVHGTVFVVDVRGEETTLTVADGQVLVSNGKGHVNVTPGNQLTFRRNVPMSSPVPVNVKDVTAWADAIEPDPDALALFMQTLEIMGVDGMSIPAMPVYIVTDLEGKEVTGIHLKWSPAPASADFCGYIVRASNPDGTPVFVIQIPGSTFEMSGRTEVFLPLQDGPVSGLESLHFRLIPDFNDGNLEPDLTLGAMAIDVAEAAVE